MTPRYRYEANYSNQLHHLGIMQSESFFPARKINDEWVLKLRKPKKRNITNNDQEKVFIHGLTDDYSGFRLCRYFVSINESTEEIIDFLKWAWANDADHEPFRGVPEILKVSNRVAKNTHFSRILS